MKLFDAVTEGNLDVVDETIKNEDVDINGRDQRGSTLLLCAVRCGHLNIMKRLLEVPGIDLDRCDVACQGNQFYC